jgi:hypothetical protein
MTCFEEDIEYFSCINRNKHREIDNRQIWVWFNEEADVVESLFIVKNNYQLSINFKFNQTTLFRYNNIADPTGKYVVKINQLMIPRDETDLDTKIKTLLTFM